MIDEKQLISPQVVCPEGIQVVMAVEVGGKKLYTAAISKGGRWVFPDASYTLPPKLLGWTGFDPSWKTREWKDH
jgi:hypothetical protein